MRERWPPPLQSYLSRLPRAAQCALAISPWLAVGLLPGVVGSLPQAVDLLPYRCSFAGVVVAVLPSLARWFLAAA